MTDRAEHDVTRDSGHSDHEGRKPTIIPFQTPSLSRRRQFLDCATEVSGVDRARHDGAEAREYSIAEIFVDAPAVPLDYRHEP